MAVNMAVNGCQWLSSGARAPLQPLLAGLRAREKLLVGVQDPIEARAAARHGLLVCAVVDSTSASGRYTTVEAPATSAPPLVAPTKCLRLQGLGMLRVFIYPRVGTACDNKWLLSKAVNLHLWEVAALELLKRALPVTTDAAQADVFLVDECLQLEYFSTRPLTHSGFFGCPRCHSLDARVVTAMRRIGVQWDTVPRRHIVTHLECPRVGHADTLDPAFPELWGKRRSLILCVQNSRPGRPDVLRTVHLPYYAHSHAGIQPIVPAINRTVDFLFAGTFSAWYPRAWLRDTMLPAASSRLLLFESREASAAELARLNELGRWQPA